ncbi:type II toxin-antitoxin system YafQ family toxin [Roseibium litorale]|nr:type II toxin-antitoxin system YafQ family toxin [Roseibium litorale]
MTRLKEVIGLIITNDGPLPPKWKDHALTGDWSDHRECHAGGDFLLIYTIDESQNLVIFTRAGTHAELFREQVSFPDLTPHRPDHRHSSSAPCG